MPRIRMGDQAQEFQGAGTGVRNWWTWLGGINTMTPGGADVLYRPPTQRRSLSTKISCSWPWACLGYARLGLIRIAAWKNWCALIRADQAAHAAVDGPVRFDRARLDLFIVRYFIETSDYVCQLRRLLNCHPNQVSLHLSVYSIQFTVHGLRFIIDVARYCSSSLILHPTSFA